MIDKTLLKEESNQPLFLKHNGQWKSCKFMWFHKGNIEVTINGTLLPIKKQSWDKLSLNEID